MQASKWFDICDKSILSPNTGVCALVDGKQIAVFWESKNDQLYAISNYCPFSKTHSLSRGLIGDSKGELLVASPLYKQRFSLQTGQCLDDQAISVPVYPVRETKGRIEISLD
ncbi:MULTISPECIES: nitrite reductase small subunit NirD [Aliagarivorans]|uniref:nitrite reductase small subunit NirD n=1 Tax=Aliagarivorans TaxID=882379 RepID=UPI000419BFC5|nr:MULTISPECIES: nitrite reductase small subunit NirD [Aliagarivorans]